MEKQQIFYTIFKEGSQIGYDWLLLCLRSLRKHSDCRIIVALVGKMESEKKIKLTQMPIGAEIVRVKDSEWDGRRLLCKLEQFNLLVQSFNRIPIPQVIMGDTDIFFMANPFRAFKKMSVAGAAVGLTTRIYKFYTPINEGMVFYFVNGAVCQYISWMIEQIKNPTWWPYLEVRSDRNNSDWNCGQDFLHALYKNGAIVGDKFKFKSIDVGPEYNYFAGCGVLGDDDAVFLMKHAIENKVAPVLHFKGDRLKKMINEIDFERYLK